MVVRALAILALAIGSYAFDARDVAHLLKHMPHHHHNEMLRVLVHERIQPHRLPLHTIIPASKTQTCDECHQHGSKWIMEHAMGQMKKMCAVAAQKECRMARVCGVMAKKPEVTMGMMIERVRPLSLTSAFCAGSRKCQRPDNETMIEIEMGMQPHDALLENFDQVDWSNVLDEARSLGPHDALIDKTDEETDEESFPVCDTPQQDLHVCPKCMKHGIKHVMHRALAKVVRMCEETSCPKKQKLCGWAKEHKAVAFGMLMAKVEPWKFALGFCTHKMHGKWDAWHVVKKVTKTLEHMGSEFVQMISV